MHRRSGIHCIEEFLAQTVGSGWASKTFVQEYGSIGNSLIQLRERRVTVFGPLIGMPATHRRDPCTFRNILAARGQRFLDLANGGRVLEDRMIARTVGEAHDMNV